MASSLIKHGLRYVNGIDQSVDQLNQRFLLDRPEFVVHLFLYHVLDLGFGEPHDLGDGLLDLMGRRWTLRILWVLRDGPLRFQALREQCEDPSPTILNRRLKELKSLQQQGLITEAQYQAESQKLLNKIAE